MFRMPLIPALVLLAFAGHVVLRIASPAATPRLGTSHATISHSMATAPLVLEGDVEARIDPQAREEEIARLRKNRGSVLAGSMLAEPTTAVAQVAYAEPESIDAVTLRALARTLRETAAKLETLAAECSAADAQPGTPNFTE